jgi:hypothetical protein
MGSIAWEETGVRRRGWIYIGSRGETMIDYDIEQSKFFPWGKIMTTYSKETKTTRRGVEDTVKENREERMLMGGDFNGRIGERRARNLEMEREDGKRKSKDKVENTEGKRLMEWIEENGWEVSNGNKQGNLYREQRGNNDRLRYRAVKIFAGRNKRFVNQCELRRMCCSIFLLIDLRLDNLEA